jgi:PAS domain S-box-containing protein
MNFKEPSWLQRFVPRRLGQRLAGAAALTLGVFVLLVLANEVVGRPDSILGEGHRLASDIARRVAALDKGRAIERSPQEVEALLQSLEAQPGLVGILVTGAGGQEIAARGETEIFGSHLSLLRPVEAGGKVKGWVRLTIDTAPLDRAQTYHGLRHLAIGLSGILSIILVLGLVLRRPLRVLEKAAAFAEQLPKRIGERLEPEAGVDEMSRLIEALNHASRRLAEQDRLVRQTQDRLVRQTQDRYFELVMIASDWIWETDSQDRLTYLSDRSEELTSIKREAVIGKSRRELSGADNPPDIWDALETATRNKRPFRNFHYQLRSPSGRLLTIRVSGNPVYGAQGEFTGYRGTAADITGEVEARAAIQRLERLTREAIDSITEGFVLFDDELRLVLCNENYRKAYPLIADLLVPGVHFHDILRAAAQRGHYAAQENEVEEWVRERITRHLGNPEPQVCHLAGERWYNISEHSTPSGGVVKLLTDITVIKNQEEQLRQSQKMDALGQLAGGLAHEFNNVLTAVGGFADMALRDVADAERAEMCLLEISKAALRATDLTGQLLSFSRNQPVERKVVDVGRAVWDLESFLRPLLGERVRLRIDPPEAGLTLLTDPSQLAQAVVNLVINARDAMPEGGDIVIRCQRRELDAGEAAQLGLASWGGYAALTVTDSGTGIAPENLKRIFEPFFTSKASGKGTGLGLSMVYGMAAQAGGTVLVESELGRGSAFTILTPLTGQAPAQPAAKQKMLQGAGQGVILAAEDDPAVLDYLKFVLTEQGFEVLPSLGGEAALAAGREHIERIDPLITDVVMPDLKGTELSARLRALKPSLKVLYISGYPDSMDVKDLPEHSLARPDAFLPKPLSPSALLDSVRSLFEPA